MNVAHEMCHTLDKCHLEEDRGARERSERGLTITNFRGRLALAASEFDAGVDAEYVAF